MKKYSLDLVCKIRELRQKGRTYGEINKNLQIFIPKSTLNWICRNVSLPRDYTNKISRLNINNLGIARATALAANQLKKERFLFETKKMNQPIAEKILDKGNAKIALAMLCLGEASKSKKSAFSLGNSDHRIISLFLDLLRLCFDDFDIKKIRCTVQCRADQDISQLEKYWSNVVNVPGVQFYKTRIDPRTVGIPTRKAGYMGVLKVDYLDKRVQFDLESLADLVYNFVHSRALSSFG